MNCAKKDCPHEGSHGVTILVYATIQHPPLEMMLGVGKPGAVPAFQVCRWHAKDLKPEDVLSEEGKRQIETALDMTKRARPDWALTKVKTYKV